MDQVDAAAHRGGGLRHAPSPRRPVVRRLHPDAVGLVRPAGAAAGERVAVDGDPGQPRGRAAPRRRAQAVQGVQRALAHAVRRRVVGDDDDLAAVGLQPLLLLRRGRRRGARRHARLVRRLRARQRAVQMAPARPARARRRSWWRWCTRRGTAATRRTGARAAGHVHAYEWFARVHAGRADPCGPVYVTIGDNGNREGLADKYVDPQPAISEFREASFGHWRLEVVNVTHALWTWRRNDDDEAVVAEQVWITSLAANPACNRNKNRM
jgi:hypothetical protein